ncbi:MAG: Rap1a/Tai family immunity protein [Alphaproteobacteria bacterium]
MKAGWLIGLATAVLIGAGGSARADKHGGGRITADDFLSLCQANAPGPRDACGTMLEGFLSVYVLLGSKDDTMRVICPPRQLPRDQARYVFIGWAEKRNDLAGMDVATGINLALRETFPCAPPIKVK